MLWIVDVLWVLVGIAIGVALGWLAARSRAGAEIARLDATLEAARAGEARLEQSLRTLTYEATEQTHAAVTEAVAPLQDALARYELRVAQLERDRVGAYEGLREQ